jgi:hypothetical protein
LWKTEAATVEEKLKFAHEKTLTRWRQLQTQVLEHRELIKQDGCIGATWKTYRGKRLGPYYRVEFRENSAIKTIYIGRNEELTKMASALIEKLKQPCREDRLLRRARAAARAALRHSLADAETYLAPLGYYRRGLGLYKRR